MKLLITLDLDNAAFSGTATGDDIAFGAVELAIGSALDRLHRGARDTPLLDVNGNRVGDARIVAGR